MFKTNWSHNHLQIEILMSLEQMYGFTYFFPRFEEFLLSSRWREFDWFGLNNWNLTIIEPKNLQTYERPATYLRKILGVVLDWQMTLRLVLPINSWKINVYFPLRRKSIAILFMKPVNWTLWLVFEIFFVKLKDNVWKSMKRIIKE